MQYRNYLGVLIIAAATACSSGSDVATAPLELSPSAARGDDGVKPPPPAGSDEVSIFIDISGDGEVEAARQSPPAAPFTGFSGNPLGRYFANTQATNGWIDFESGNDIVATAGARLSYNEETGRSNGRGTLTNAAGQVLDLSKVTVVPDDEGVEFGPCDRFGRQGLCANFAVAYEGELAGFITVVLRPLPEQGSQ